MARVLLCKVYTLAVKPAPTGRVKVLVVSFLPLNIHAVLLVRAQGLNLNCADYFRYMYELNKGRKKRSLFHKLW